MGSAQFEEAIGLCNAVDAAFDTADALPTDGLCQSERILVLERRERWRRRLPAGEHVLLAELAYARVEEIGGRMVVHAAPGSGTEIEFHMPVPAAVEASP
jgi:hypothetical protein